MIPKALISAALIGTVWSAVAADAPQRAALWVDMLTAEPTTYEDVLSDLAQSRVIYLGEVHSIARHHRQHANILRGLLQRGAKLALGLECIELRWQGEVDRYNRNELDFDGLAAAIQWRKQWSSYKDYSQLMETVHASGGPILALNAPLDVVRQVARRGIDSLSAEQRASLPRDLTLDALIHERYLHLILRRHRGMTEEMLRRFTHAQRCRDETMAATAVEWLRNPANSDRVLVIVCGGGHASYGLGIPAGIRRRLPGIRDRIILFSESGDLVMTDEMKRQSQEITVTHDDLRFLSAPIADYAHIVAPRPPHE